MFLERLRGFFIGEKKSVPPEPQDSVRYLGYLDQTQRFQFTTFATDLDQERAMQDLQSAGFSIVGVMDGNRVRKLTMIDPSNPNHPRSSRFLVR